MDVNTSVSILETHAMNEKEALELSCEYLGAEPDDIMIALRQKGSSGFLGLGQKKPSVFHVLARPGKTPLEIIVKGVISSIVNKMGYKVKFNKIAPTEDEKLYVEMVSQSAGFIIGKYGKTLESLQFLANLLVEKVTGSQPKILLDIEKYRERRQKHLEDIAVRTAKQVAQTGRYRLLDPLNPYERRIVHMALQENDMVQTESEGNSVYKRVKIFLKPGVEPLKSKNEAVEEETLPEFMDGQDPEAVYNDANDLPEDDDIGNRIEQDHPDEDKNFNR
ncbi:MAG: KH domain-containing protein [Leptospiraceae bacterium]|nr:KH domain-containing protein [Leptospiraceae bacterium]MCB1201319.1 KH domain-containing protein [Leptospiraceae bacterium]